MKATPDELDALFLALKADLEAVNIRTEDLRLMIADRALRMTRRHPLDMTLSEAQQVAQSLRRYYSNIHGVKL